jgi:hypothetical protein
VVFHADTSSATATQEQEQPALVAFEPTATDGSQAVAAAIDTAAMHNFYVISLVYLLFTITDTALRVAILLHVNNLGFSAFEISLMFCTYELCGVLTNFAGGILATQIGFQYTLLTGIACQIVSVCLLVPFRDSTVFDQFPTLAGRIAYIAFSQCFSGIAKDMVKLSGKSVSKLVIAKEAQSDLFRIVTNITGAKNAVKGTGFFFGTLLLQFAGFQPTLLVLLGLLVLLVPFIWLQLTSALGRSRKQVVWSQVLRKPTEFNLLCVARLFLFSSRDVWFEVVLPIYFRNQLRWESIAVGSFLAGWVIMYGGVQSNTERLALKPLGCRPPTTRHLWPWAGALGVVTIVVALAFSLTVRDRSIPIATTIVVTGLTVYAVVFAVNSSVHSYLVVLLSDHDKVAQDVGFYYMSNALGRFVGILVGGVLFSFYAQANDSKTEDYARSESFAACLWASSVLTILSAIFAGGITWARSPTPASPQRAATALTPDENHRTGSITLQEECASEKSDCHCCENDDRALLNLPAGDVCYKSCPACCHEFGHPCCTSACSQRHTTTGGTLRHTHQQLIKRPSTN